MPPRLSTGVSLLLLGTAVTPHAFAQTQKSSSVAAANLCGDRELYVLRGEAGRAPGTGRREEVLGLGHVDRTLT